MWLTRLPICYWVVPLSSISIPGLAKKYDGFLPSFNIILDCKRLHPFVFAVESYQLASSTASDSKPLKFHTKNCKHWLLVALFNTPPPKKIYSFSKGDPIDQSRGLCYQKRVWLEENKIRMEGNCYWYQSLPKKKDFSFQRCPFHRGLPLSKQS